MRTLLDPALRESASLAATRSVQQLSMENMSRQYLQLYETLLLPNSESLPSAGRNDRHTL
jgi:hypothetical protein